MCRVDGIKELEAKLRKKAREIGAPTPAVYVGYTQSYAIYVHENLESYHNPPTQAKYLEQPFRQLRSVYIDIVTEALQKGASLPKGLLLAGLRLQRESQLLCPVDTSALRNSAFTRLVEDDR